MIVSMQLASAVATRSDGENLSPFPWLSGGVNLTFHCPEDMGLTDREQTVRRFPSYNTVEVIVLFLYKFTFKDHINYSR